MSRFNFIPYPTDSFAAWEKLRIVGVDGQVFKLVLDEALSAEQKKTKPPALYYTDPDWYTWVFGENSLTWESQEDRGIDVRTLVEQPQSWFKKIDGFSPLMIGDTALISRDDENIYYRCTFLGVLHGRMVYFETKPGHAIHFDVHTAEVDVVPAV